MLDENKKVEDEVQEQEDDTLKEPVDSEDEDLEEEEKVESNEKDKKEDKEEKDDVDDKVEDEEKEEEINKDADEEKDEIEEEVVDIEEVERIKKEKKKLEKEVKELKLKNKLKEKNVRSDRIDYLIKVGDLMEVEDKVIDEKIEETIKEFPEWLDSEGGEIGFKISTGEGKEKHQHDPMEEKLDGLLKRMGIR